MRQRAVLLRAGSALILAGAAVLAIYWYNLLHSGMRQTAARGWLNSAEVAGLSLPEQLTPTPAKAAKPPKTPIHRGDVVGELIIPRLDVSVMVFEGADQRTLK